MTSPGDTLTFDRERHLFTEPLQIKDRCERCGAQAFVVTRIGTTDLMWCAHHYRKHQDHLLKIAVAIMDDTGKINEKPSTSANVE